MRIGVVAAAAGLGRENGGPGFEEFLELKSLAEPAG